MLHESSVHVMSTMQHQSNVHGASVNGMCRIFVLGWQLPSTVQCLAHWQSGHCV